MARDKKLIQFYLTTYCNSRCNTCNIWRTYKNDTLDVNRVYEVCLSNQDADFVLGGGEFTLYKYKHILLDTLNENNISYTILSNAVNKLLLEQVLNNHNVKNLTISFDGINHDTIRGIKGNLKNIQDIVFGYRHKIPNIKLSYTYSKFNEEYFIQDMDYIKNVLGFDKVYFCIAQDMELLKNPGESVKPKSIEQILERSDMLYDKDRLYIERLVKGEKKPCDSTSSVFTIYSNGDVVTCQSFMCKKVLGNIYERSFNDIISNAEVFSCPYDSECNLLCQRRYD